MKGILIYQPTSKSAPLADFIDGLDPRLREKILLRLYFLTQLEKPEMKEPHFKRFSIERYRDLWELRVKSKVLIRIIFCTLPNGDVLLLHGFVKRQKRDTMQALEQSTVTFGNDKMGSLLIVKKDAVTGAPISDVEFFITDSDGSVIGNANGKYVTDSAGTIRIDGLTPGMTVIAREVRAKDGYILDDTPQSIKIKRNAVMTMEFRNQPKGGVLVKKVDAVTNAPISDVEFLVTDSDGNLIGNANGKFVTDSAGTFSITDIAPGTPISTRMRTSWWASTSC